jgi:outer membrane protein assembly factor BamB
MEISIMRVAFLRSLTLFALVVSALSAADWPRFRGENGAGIAADDASTPVEWAADKNVKWSVDLPGQGASCPIVVGDKVLVTSWSGAGPEDLVRHLSCYDRQSGKELWKKDIKPVVEDEPYRGMFMQTGYTAHTPASDGEHVYCFFGVSGVTAFDLDGNEKWTTSVGTEFDGRNWGTAASPIVVGDLVIVNAAAESQSLVALNKQTGEEVWRLSDAKLESTWGTPIVVKNPSGKDELLISPPSEVWGVDPATGKKLWSCTGTDPNAACSSVVVEGDVAFMLNGRRGGSPLAVRIGGEGDVTESHLVWAKNVGSSISTPIVHNGVIYTFGGGFIEAVDAKTGESLKRERLDSLKPEASKVAARPVALQEQPPELAEDGERPRRFGPGGPGGGRFGGPGGPGGGRFGGRGGRGGFMSQDYGSPIAADGKLYFTRRTGETLVFKLGPELKLLASNKLDEGDYSATPAISNGEIFVRSSKKLYCLAEAAQ